ncbi:heparinase [Butyrivibrio sp. CB08]|uniref:heparinase II/III domain-containing protein n=1 Tax=Butyrivibrio sp. CB08 TaxID=2364879 RepID=UPI000EAAA0CB|nr:heparinase II/III family protein [Butyrivibrio sp. CB08]RKM59986.1 heparinase [Butyrivibrio sp. CB08]
MKRTIVSDHVKETKGASAFFRYPDISHRERWEGLSSSLKKDIIEAGEEALLAPWTQLLISDFTQFSKTGERLPFEDKYFPRRKKLAGLIMAECVENKGRFMDDILDGLYLILEETTWCLPAHNTYVRDAVQEYLPSASRPVIDLFDAETGAFVAMAEYLLRPAFDKISPYISQYVDERLNERIFKPYFREHFWWMGNGKEPMCNWTPWITQNILIAALTRRETYFTQEERRYYLEKAAVSLDFFLDEYGDDGCCNEGAQYYSHAGLCLFGALHVMSSVLETSFTDIFKNELIRNIGSYIVKMHACGDYYINFADCSPICGRRTAREYLFGKATGDEALKTFAAADFAKGSASERLITDEINLFYHVLQVLNYDEMLGYEGKEISPQDSFFDSTGLMIARDERYVLAAKAGNNADSHNHNDVGSFTVYKDGKPMIIDLGVETYTGKTFSDKRYEIWTMQSQFHNLPTFLDGDYKGSLGKAPEMDVYDMGVVMQRDGGRFGAYGVTCDLEGRSLQMDIAPAYGDTRVKSYKRKIALLPKEGIQVVDNYVGALRSVMSLMTYEKPEVTDEGQVSIIKLGDLGEVRIEGSLGVNVETYPVLDERLKICWKHEVYRVLITMGEEGNLKLEIQ